MPAAPSVIDLTSDNGEEMDGVIEPGVAVAVQMRKTQQGIAKGVKEDHQQEPNFQPPSQAQSASNEAQIRQFTPIDPYTAWNWPRYFTYAQENALEEHFEKDQYQWRIKYVEIASQIRADVDMVKDWFSRRRLASRGCYLDANRRIQRRVNFYDPPAPIVPRPWE